jgi:hypothetical protein
MCVTFALADRTGIGGRTGQQGAKDRGIDLLWALEADVTFPHRKAIEEVCWPLLHSSQHV